MQLPDCTDIVEASRRMSCERIPGYQNVILSIGDPACTASHYELAFPFHFLFPVSQGILLSVNQYIRKIQLSSSSSLHAACRMTRKFRQSMRIRITLHPRALEVGLKLATLRH